MSRRSARASRGHQRTSIRRRRCEYRTSERPDRVGQNPLRVDTLESHLESNECSPRRPPSVRGGSLFARACISPGSKGPALASGRIANREQCYNRANTNRRNSQPRAVLQCYNKLITGVAGWLSNSSIIIEQNIFGIVRPQRAFFEKRRAG